MIDDNLGLGDFGKRIAFARQFFLQRQFAADHGIGIDRIVILHAKRRLDIGLGHARHIDRAEFIQRPRLDAERDNQPPVLWRDIGFDVRIIIALGAQDRIEQFGVIARAPVNLRDVGRLARAFFQDRKFVEARADRRSERIDARHDKIITLAIRHFDLRGCCLKRWRNRIGPVQIGPFDAEIGQWRHRRFRVKRGRLGMRGRCQHQRGHRRDRRPPHIVKTHGPSLTALGRCDHN